MIPGCPSCGRPHKSVQWEKNPPYFAFIYPCCGKREEFYFDSIHRWESRKARQERLKIPVICGCGEEFSIPDAAKHESQIRTMCDKCLLIAERNSSERRKKHAQDITKNRKRTNPRFMFKYGGHNGSSTKA